MASRRARLPILLAVLQFAVLLLLFFDAGGTLFGTAYAAAADPAEKIPIKVLILPKFEVDAMSADFPGEAQLYYEAYLAGERNTKFPMRRRIAVCETVRRRGLLDRLIVLRCSVNMDAFMGGATPEILWGMTARTTGFHKITAWKPRTSFSRRWRTTSLWAARSSTPFCRAAFERKTGGP